MAQRLLTSPQARLLRWLLLGALCSMGATLLVTGGTLLLPDDVARSMSDLTYGALVLGTTLALSAGVFVRTRRNRPRPPR